MRKIIVVSMVIMLMLATSCASLERTGKDIISDFGGGKGNELGLDCDGCREDWLKRDAVDYSGLLYWKKNTTYGE